MRCGVSKLCLLASFVILNLGIAAVPLKAAYRQDLCAGEGGEPIPCCTSCLIFFCNCIPIPDGPASGT